MHDDKKEIVLKKGQKAVEVSALVSLALAILKGAAGFLSGSVALLSSALDSFVDLVGQATSWLGFKISQRKPDQHFPYGYYKAESLATLVISFFIIYAALRLFIEGYSRFFVPSDLEFPLIALAVALINICSSFFLSKYLGKVGKEISSPLLLTCSRERKMDIISGLAVFLAVFTSYYHVPYVEGIVVMALSILILRIGISSVKDAMLVLMDVSPSNEIEHKVRKVIGGFDDADSYNGLKLRKSGPFIFGEVKLRVKKSITVQRAHELAEKIEDEVKKRVSGLDSLTVHIEPRHEGKCKIAIPVRSLRGLKSPAYPGIKKAPYMLFAVLDKDRKSIERYYIRKKPVVSRKDFSKVEKFVSKENVDFLASPRMGSVSRHLQRYHMVGIYSLKGKTAREVIDNFLAGKLKKL